MPVDLILPVSIIFSILSWTLIMRWYIHPVLMKLHADKAFEPFLLLHSFRYIGLMFLVTGVTSAPLDLRFSEPAAYGDLLAAILAFIALFALRLNLAWKRTSVWVFNIWGLIDLLVAVTLGLLFTVDGHLGATFWIPATIVPLLLVTHVYIFYLLLNDQPTKENLNIA